jgi:hypothetical protein
VSFVVGCARSGTSILGELIGSHNDVSFVFEASAAWRSAGDGEAGSHRLTEHHATPAVADEVAAWFAAQRGTAQLVVEKNPRNTLRIPFLRAIFPSAPIIHIIRDGRDVACSLMPGVGGSEWRHLKPPNWARLQRDERGLRRCALLWRDVLTIALDDLDGARVLQVRYEDLVARPHGVAGQALAFLELPASNEVEAFCANVRNDVDAPYHSASGKWFRDDHAVRVGRWREERARQPEAIAEIEALLAPMLTHLGYPVQSSEPGPAV